MIPLRDLHTLEGEEGDSFVLFVVFSCFPFLVFR